MKDGTLSPIVIKADRQADQCADRQRRDDRQRLRHPDIVDVFHQERRQREDLADRQIDLAANQQHDLAAGDDDRRGNELRQRLRRWRR